MTLKIIEYEDLEVLLKKVKEEQSNIETSTKMQMALLQLEIGLLSVEAQNTQEYVQLEMRERNV